MPASQKYICFDIAKNFGSYSQACIPWGEPEASTGAWPQRSWYLCTEKATQAGATCKLLEEEVPGFEGRTAWACSIPHFDLAEDRGDFYEDMMA